MTGEGRSSAAGEEKGQGRCGEGPFFYRKGLGLVIFLVKNHVTYIWMSRLGKIK